VLGTHHQVGSGLAIGQDRSSEDHDGICLLGQVSATIVVNLEAQEGEAQEGGDAKETDGQ
jgi:hypothetical protein